MKSESITITTSIYATADAKIEKQTPNNHPLILKSKSKRRAKEERP